jgi:hypothetical protein
MSNSTMILALFRLPRHQCYFAEKAHYDSRGKKEAGKQETSEAGGSKTSQDCHMDSFLKYSATHSYNYISHLTGQYKLFQKPLLASSPNKSFLREILTGQYKLFQKPLLASSPNKSFLREKE